MSVSAPTLLTATSIDGGAELTWSTIPLVTYYIVKYGTSPGIYTTEVSVGTVTSYTVTGLNNATTYYFVVVAVIGILLYLKCEGTDSSTTFVDSTGRHTVTAFGTAQIDTAQAAVGSASALFAGGASDQLRVADSDDFYFSGLDFSMEFRVRFSSVAAGTYCLLSQWGDGGANGSFYIAYQTNSGGGAQKKLYFFRSQDGASEDPHELDITATPFLVNTWYKIRFDRVGTDLFWKIDDVLVATSNIGINFNDSTRNLNVSGYSDGSSANQSLNGWIDEVKIIKGDEGESSNSNELSSIYRSAITATGRYRRCGFVRTATISTLDVSHLEGQKVAILANGNFLGFQTVVDGAIILNEYYSKIIVGLPYVSDLETLSIELPTKEGTLVGRKTLFSNVTLRMIKSAGGRIGPKESKLPKNDVFTEDALAMANQIDEQDDPIGDDTVRKLYTTDIRKPTGAQYSGGARVFYRQTLPLPVTISAIVPEISPTQQSA